MTSPSLTYHHTLQLEPYRLMTMYQQYLTIDYQLIFRLSPTHSTPKI